MILGCHDAVDKATNQHRLDEIIEAEARIVDAAAGSVLTALLAASSKDDAGTLRKVWGDAWFVEYALSHHDRNQGPVRIRAAFSAVDLAELREAIGHRRALILEVNAERRAMLESDDMDLELEMADLVDTPCPRVALAETAVRWPGGRPRPLFHVTGAAFDTFKPLSHFGSASAVSRHAFKRLMTLDHEPDVRVVAAWVDIRQPLRIADLGGGSSYWLVEAVVQAGALSKDEAASVTGIAEDGFRDAWWNDAGNRATSVLDVEAALAGALWAKGYDGLVYTNSIEGGGDTWVVLDGSQVHQAGEWRYECDAGSEQPFALLDDAPSLGIAV